jgi:ferredoxin
VVIPLPRLGDYSDGIERINIELSVANKLRLLDTLTEYFQGNLPVDTEGGAVSADEIIGERRSSALELIATLRQRWQWLLDNLDAPFAQYRSLWPDAPLVDANASPSSVFIAMRDFQLRVSWKDELLNDLENLFSGKADAPILDAVHALHQKVLRGRVFVALHMHAGDGNVHTNMPVNSDDYDMLQTAHKAVARIMQLARSLNGVISGEHGIGITKLEFLTEDEIAPFRAYKQRVDPKGHFNRGKLLPGADLTMAYTPSFSLLGAESLILEQSDIGAISNSVKDCLRCGKCKPVCSTHVPRANLLYSPRNKILGVGLLTEAFLYEEQTRRGVSLKHFDELSDVADHCTVCHRCVKPCPVKIDFGDVSVAMRNFLRKTGNKRFNPGTALGMAFLTVKDPATIKAIRGGLVGFAYKAQRLGYSVGKKLHLTGGQTKQPPSTVGKARSRNRSSTSSTSRCRAACPRKPPVRCWMWKTPMWYRSSATRRWRKMPKRCSTSPAAARNACSARSASPPRPCCGMWAPRPCCRRAICAAAIRRPRQATPTRAKPSPRKTACCSTVWPTR